MKLHAQGVYPGEVPRSWLLGQDSFICNHCLQLVSNSRLSSHSRRCTGDFGGSAGAGAGDHAVQVSPSTVEGLVANNIPGPSLPNLEDVFLLNQPTLCFIPSKSRPAFARVLSSVTRNVILENSDEAWLKLFMLPKCVLPSSQRRGLHDKTPLNRHTLQHVD